MSSLRDVCRCGHVTRSHGPACSSCECSGFHPAFLVFDSFLPVGVEPVTFYPSTGLTVVACSHRLERLHSWCPFCFSEARFTDCFTVPVQRLVFAPRELRLL